LEGASLLATFVAGFALFRTGAARTTVGPAALLAVGGVGLFGVSFLANVYATAAPPDGLGQARTRLPLLESKVGYLYVVDPHFSYRHFVVTEVDGALGRIHLGARTAHAPGQDNQRFEGLVGYRWVGPSGPASQRASDGSSLELSVGYSEHHFDGEGFLYRQLETSLMGRLDSERYLPDVRGAFVQYQAGVATQRFEFDLPGVDAHTDTSMLLAHVGFGVYLGNRGPSPLGPTGGEVEVYYDHRRDGLAGGIKTRLIGNGPVGHAGVSVAYQLTPRFGIQARGQVGSAWTAGLSAVIRGGVQ
jgi:hypothetical protein